MNRVIRHCFNELAAFGVAPIMFLVGIIFVCVKPMRVGTVQPIWYVFVLYENLEFSSSPFRIVGQEVDLLSYFFCDQRLDHVDHKLACARNVGQNNNTDAVFKVVLQYCNDMLD